MPDGTGRLPGGGLNAPGAYTDSSGKARVILTLSRQPGNNFIVSATTNPFYTSRLRLRAADGRIIEDLTGVALPNAQAKLTPLLTVWRHLQAPGLTQLAPSESVYADLTVLFNTAIAGREDLHGENTPINEPGTYQVVAEFYDESFRRKIVAPPIEVQVNLPTGEAEQAYWQVLSEKR